MINIDTDAKNKRQRYIEHKDIEIIFALRQISFASSNFCLNLSNFINNLQKIKVYYGIKKIFFLIMYVSGPKRYDY